MPPQPPGALDDQIDGREVRDHQIEVKVEALLYDLCCNKHLPPWRIGTGFSAAAETTHNFCFDALPVGHGEAGVEQQRLQSRFAEAVAGIDCLVNAVAHEGHPRARLRRRDDPRKRAFKITDPGGGHETRKTISNGLGRLVNAGGSDDGDERIIGDG
jgi:hypothetical protein